jgi:hypothetical protein
VFIFNRENMKTCQKNENIAENKKIEEKTFEEQI